MAHVYTIEFQIWELPHMHFFIFFAIEDKIIDVVTIDQFFCAKFLYPKVDPIFFNTILKTMVHSPCGPHNFVLHAWKMQGVPNVTLRDSKNWPLWMLMDIICIEGETTLDKPMKHKAF